MRGITEAAHRALQGDALPSGDVGAANVGVSMAAKSSADRESDNAVTSGKVTHEDLEDQAGINKGRGEGSEGEERPQTEMDAGDAAVDADGKTGSDVSTCIGSSRSISRGFPSSGVPMSLSEVAASTAANAVSAAMAAGGLTGPIIVGSRGYHIGTVDTTAIPSRGSGFGTSTGVDETGGADERSATSAEDTSGAPAYPTSMHPASTRALESARYAGHG